MTPDQWIDRNSLSTKNTQPVFGPQISNSPTDSTAFEFGKNWSKFLVTVNDQRIDVAKQSIANLLACDSLESSTFLDAGSGSGLFSLAANQLSATVTSIDVDPQSVACTAELRKRYGKSTETWTVAEGAILDKDFMVGLGQFDVVDCWGGLITQGRCGTQSRIYPAASNPMERLCWQFTTTSNMFRKSGDQSSRFTIVFPGHCVRRLL